jgi:thiol-disulfide isomerase/thioredoxin
MSFKLSRRHALYAGVATVAAAAGVGVALRRHASEAVTPDALQAVWASEFDTPKGETLKLADFRGKPLVLNFWATWCPPCVEEMPLLDAFFRQNSANGWQVIGLAIDQPSLVKRFMGQFPVDYPIALGGMNGSELGRLLGNAQGGLPFTVVFDAAGNVKVQKLGKLSADEIKSWT